MVNDYFVQVKDNQPLQSALLTIAKRSLLSSQQYYSLLEIRKEKSALIEQVSTQMTDLKKSYQDLFDILPHQELVAQEKKRQQKQNASSKITKKTSTKTPTSKKQSQSSSKNKTHSSSPEEALKESLATIEKKLSQLS
ncbi:MAG: hypothetical protein ACOCQQ_00110 [Candidatus Nanoarchaeia archaeon]